MGDAMRLELGAQTQAARLIVDRLPEIDGVLKGLASTVEAQAAGFKGGSSAALVEALRGWFTAAQKVTPLLGDYAASLAAVDEAVSQADRRGTSGLSTAYTGASGLNMGVE